MTQDSIKEESSEATHEEMIDAFLESLHYNNPAKEDVAMLQHIRSHLQVDNSVNLRNYLLHQIDFSTLFALLFQILEPFVQMLQEIYQFLSSQQTTARALQKIIVGEDMVNRVPFELNTFPYIYKAFLKEVDDIICEFDNDKMLDFDYSPLCYTEHLMGCGYCTDPNYPKIGRCLNCGVMSHVQISHIFAQMSQLIDYINKTSWPARYQNPEDRRRINVWIDYFNQAKEMLDAGRHSASPCPGCEYWQGIWKQIENRFEAIIVKRIGSNKINVFARFFTLPFWRERDRLYEVWVLVHFISLLQDQGMPVELFVKQKEWRLSYNNASKPVAQIRGSDFMLEVWYQHKIKEDLQKFEDEPIEPDLLFLLRRARKRKLEPLILIECKERKDFSDREMKIWAAFCEVQYKAKLNIFCNYLDYKSQKSIQLYRGMPLDIFCAQFRPSSSVVEMIDKEFLAFLQDQIKSFYPVTLFDLSGSMLGKDVELVYQDLNHKFASSSVKLSKFGIFAKKSYLYSIDQILSKVSNPPQDLGGETYLQEAIERLNQEIQPGLSSLQQPHWYVITDMAFGQEDWQWLENVEKSKDHHITFIVQKSWIEAEDLTRITNWTHLRYWVL